MPPRVDDTLGDTRTTAAPAAFTVLAGLTGLPAGIYSARVIMQLTGTAEVALVNARLRHIVNAVTTKFTTLPTISGLQLTLDFDRIQVSEGASVDVANVAIATGGSIYTVTLLLTRLT